jgi:hypothetical protein
MTIEKLDFPWCKLFVVVYSKTQYYALGGTDFPDNFIISGSLVGARVSSFYFPSHFRNTSPVPKHVLSCWGGS